jgi:hypothetical protein
MPDESLGHERPSPPPAEPAAREPLPELTLGRPRTPRDLTKPRSEIRLTSDSDDEGLEALAADCRAKAEAARWAAERQRRLRERYESPDEGAPTDPAMRLWAERLTDAFYWAGAEDPAGAPDISPLDHVGGCFEALAEGLRLVQRSLGRRGGLEKALPLLAEGQSAVRRALRRLEAPDDPDQLAAYEIVRETAARHRIFLKRFLRADDLAAPESWPGLLSRIEAQAGAPSQLYVRLLDRLRPLVHSPGEGGDADASWRSIIEAVEEAVGEGVPPSSREVRGALLPHIDELPEGIDVPPGFRRVLREIDRYLATRSPTATTTTTAPAAEAVEAARLLSGRGAVLIGGLRRPQAQRALRAALGLHELVWIGTREHQSIRGFEAAIARPEVAVVLLAIRWSSHSFGEVKGLCDRHGKPLVRLPGGYNPAQVAAQILDQCGERLRGR